MKRRVRSFRNWRPSFGTDPYHLYYGRRYICAPVLSWTLLLTINGNKQCEDDMTRLTNEEHLQLLKLAEQQFRLACTVNFAVTTGRMSLDVPVEMTFGRHHTDYREFGLRLDQASYAAPLLEFVATFVMASTIRRAFEDCIPNANAHSDMNIACAYQIARLIRNAFAHNMLHPVWSIDKNCRDQCFCISDVISLNTSGLHEAPFEWQNYGGHLAIWRLSQWVRFKVFGDKPPGNRVEPPYPSIEAFQQGRLVLIKQSDPAANDDVAMGSKE